MVRPTVATVDPPRARDADPEALSLYMTDVQARFAGRLETDLELEQRVRPQMRRCLARTG